LFAFSLGTTKDYALIVRESWVPEPFAPPLNFNNIMIIVRLHMWNWIINTVLFIIKRNINKTC
jgi:hypothetical protein